MSSVWGLGSSSAASARVAAMRPPRMPAHAGVAAGVAGADPGAVNGGAVSCSPRAGVRGCAPVGVRGGIVTGCDSMPGCMQRCLGTPGIHGIIAPPGMGVVPRMVPPAELPPVTEAAVAAATAAAAEAVGVGHWATVTGPAVGLKLLPAWKPWPQVTLPSRLAKDKPSTDDRRGALVGGAKVESSNWLAVTWLRPSSLRVRPGAGLTPLAERSEASA
mmetsp:Transcript_10903/g.29122  ORF Transcript_10903/g.29122 Transcript_10903/m.29122 type:complete len:217 (-) Transcript_10903:1169-1819(-)